MPIDKQMETVVNHLVQIQARISEGTFNSDQRPWMNFEDLKKVGQFDFAGLKEIFTRQQSNDEYGKLRSASNGDALSKDIQTLKLSADYLASLERDTRMRRRSRIRMFVHAGCRSAANGADNGPLRVNSLDWLSRIMTEQKKAN